MELIVLTVAGFIATVIAQLVKKGLKVEGKTAVIISYGISLALAAGAGFYSGEIVTISDLVLKSAMVFAVATLAYKLIIDAFEFGK